MPTVKELKENLAALGEKVGGSKAELEARLAAAKKENKPKRTKERTSGGSATIKKAPAKPGGKKPPQAASRGKRKTGGGRGDGSGGDGGAAGKKGAGGDTAAAAARKRVRVGTAAAAEKKKKKKPAAAKARTQKHKAAAPPATFKGQILALGRGTGGVRWTEKLSLQAVKAGLVREFGREDSAAFRKHVGKALQSLVAAGTLIKLGGSYREPKTAEEEAQDAADAAERRRREEEGVWQCVWCGEWAQAEHGSNGFEARDARGWCEICNACGQHNWSSIGQEGMFRHYRLGQCGMGGYN